MGLIVCQEKLRANRARYPARKLSGVNCTVGFETAVSPLIPPVNAPP